MLIPIKRLIGTSNIRMEILFSAVQNAYFSCHGGGPIEGNPLGL